MSNESKVIFKSFEVTIASAGSAEDLSTAGIKSMDLILMADPANTGTIAVGDVDGQFLILGSEPLILSNFFKNGIERYVTLDDVKIKGTTNSDKVSAMYTIVS